MRFLYTLLAIALCLLVGGYGFAAPNHTAKTPPVLTEISPNLTVEDVLIKSPTDIETEIGRALTRKERRTIKRLKKQLKKVQRINHEPPKWDKMSVAAFVFVTIGLTFLSLATILGGVLMITGYILGNMALTRHKFRSEKRQGRTLALFAVWLCVVFLLLGSGFIIVPFI